MELDYQVEDALTKVFSMYDIRIRNLCLLFIPFLLGNKKKSTCSPRATSAFSTVLFNSVF